MSQKIRIKLKSYDFNLVDKSAEKIVKTVKTTGAIVTGPIPLPTKKKIFTVLKSPHVNKKAREQFQLSSYKRLLDIYSSSSKTIDALMKLELPSGVEMIMPGDNVKMNIKLITPIAMADQLRFAIREGGRTVGSGVITKVIK